MLLIQALVFLFYRMLGTANMCKILSKWQAIYVFHKR